MDQEQKQKYKEQLKKMLKPLKYGAGVFVCFCFLYYGYQFYATASKKLIYMTRLNDVIAQISQVIDNVRQAYILYHENFDVSAGRWSDKNYIPKVLIKNNHLRNIYGGEILVASSETISNERGTKTSPTFKISFQGLSKSVCMDLAQMNWGDKRRGLVAVAIGSVDRQGFDSAFNDVDAEQRAVTFREIMDKTGKVYRIRERMPEKRNVVKPNSPYMGPPFSSNDADLGCNCQTTSNTCSIALRYAVFKVD